MLEMGFELTILFVTHDLSVVQHIADRIAVMYLGKFFDTSRIDEVLCNHMDPDPYSMKFISD